MLFNRRYWRIVLFFGRLTLNVILWEIVLRQLGLGGWANRTAQDRYTRAARRFRLLAVTLGGVMIKAGQFLSTRADVLPYYVTSELEGLQDEVPPVPTPLIHAALESELHTPLTEFFATFDDSPLAAASLGQTHRARLPDGANVVVKVLRPGIEKVVEIDLQALHTVTQWLKRYPPIGQRADVEALLTEFGATLRDELNYQAEIKHAARFAKLFRDDPNIYIPHVYAEHCTGRVIVMEDVSFIKITDYAVLEAAGLSRAEVAERLFHTYLQQIFEFNFFHADPHPGNLFVRPAEGDRPWQLVFVDFGMVGEVTPKIRTALREAALAIGLRDPARLIRAMQSVDALLPGADTERLLQAQTEVFDRYWGKSMGELRATDPREIAAFANRFRDLIFELPFQVPRNLLYLGRTVAILSGMCTGLNPHFNLFDGITPFAQTLVAEELGSAQGFAFWRDQVVELLQHLVALPNRLDTVLARMERGQMTVNVQPSGRAPEANDLLRAINRLSGALLTSTLLGVGAALYLNGQVQLGWGSWGLAALALLWTVRGR